MRFSTSAVLACAVAFVAAQDLSQIPQCALPCFASAVQASGCALSDTKCQCTTGQAKITESVTACVPSKCSAADIAKLAPAAAAICSAAGYPVSAAASGASSAGAAMSSAASSAASAVASATASKASASASASNATASAPAQSTGAAGANFVNGALVIAMGILAL